MILQLNKIQYPLYNLGPGERIGIWVQGCSIHCKGCINKSTWPKENGKKMHVLELYGIVKRMSKDYDGITITGGEPFDQYKQLMAFSLLIKRKTALNILCYSGYYLEELEKMFPDRAFFKCLDILIDGRYNGELASSATLKGSENQNIYEFVDGRPVKSKIRNLSKKWSLACDDGSIYMAGIPARNEMDTLFDNMRSAGINLKLS